MVKSKQKISVILVVALVFSMLVNPFIINTASASTLGNVTLGGDITEWKLDEANGYIYAISETSNTLWFIGLDTLQVEKELNVGSMPSDIEIYNNKLYIPLSGATQVAVVDIATTTVENTITTAFNPYRIAIDNNKLFYVEYDQHCYLYEYDLTTGIETNVGSTSYYEPDLEVDRTNHILYIAESGSSGSNLEAISTVDYSKVSETTYDTGYGFPYPDRRVILDGEDIFYAGTKLDKNNLAIIHGEYPNVTYTKNNYIFDGYSIYDRDKYVKITDLPYYSTLVLMDNSNNIYLFNSDTYTIEKIALDLTLYPTTYSNLGNTINLTDTSLSNWEYDSSTNYIYGISETSNKLLFINPTNLEVEKEIYVGSKPSGIEIYNGKLYIPLSGATKIAVVDLTTKTLESEIIVAHNPYSIAIDNNKIFYVEYDQHCYLYEYDLTTEIETKVGLTSYYEPDLEADRTNHILYIAESGSSGSNLEAISTVDYVKYGETTYDTGYGFPYPDRRVILDGEDIFYAGRKLDRNNLATIHGEYPNVTYAKSNYVFDGYSVFERDTYVKITDLPYYSSLVLMDNSNNIYLFNSDTNTIEKTSLDLTLYPTTYSNLGNTINLSDTSLSDWEYDSSTNYIYGISETSNKLLFINPTNLEVEKEIYVGSKPSGIEIYNGKLYIPLSGATKIAVVDLATKTLESEIIVAHNPYSIAIDNNKIFYVEYDQHCYLYEYDLLTGTEKKITVVGDTYTSYYQPDLEVDRTNHILYVGESGLSSSVLEAISILDYTRINQTISFSYPDRKVILDGEDIFYAGRKINKNDLSNVLGQYHYPDYPYNEDVYYVNNNYVFTDIAVYDRDTYQEIFTIDNSSLLFTIDNSNNLYLYGATNNTIYQYNSVEQYNMGYPNEFFAALSSNGDLFLLWDPVIGAEGYNLYYEYEEEPSRPINLEFSYNVDPDSGYLYTVIPKSTFDLNWIDKNIYFGVTAVSSGKESTISYMQKIYMDSELIFKPQAPTYLDVIYDVTVEPILRATWDIVPDVDGYNIYYKTSNDLDFTKLNSETVTQAVYDSTVTEVVYDINFGEIDTTNWEGQIIDFAVTSIDNGYESNKTISSYIFMANNLIPIDPVDTIEPIEEPEDTTNNTTPSTTNKSEPEPEVIEPIQSLDDIISTEVTTTEDGTTSVSVELDETQFDELIDQNGEDVEEYVINVEEEFSSVVVTIPGNSYNKLNGKGEGKKIVINTDSGKYLLPVDNINISEELEKHENEQIEIEIKKVDIGELEQTFTINDYELLVEPIDFSVNIVTENEKIEIGSFGSEYVERWIPLTKNPDKWKTVGIMFNEETGLIQPVPTTFYLDENGKNFAIIKRNGNSIYSVVEHEKSFDDIDGYTAKEDIELLASKLIVNGVSETEFAPDKTVTRAEYAALLVRALGLTSDNSSEIKFSDVKDTAWYAETVKIAVEYGLINGYGDGTFKPNKTISREEITVMTVNALQFVNGKQEADETIVSQYTDYEFINNWAIDSIAIASEEQIIGANSNNNFVPDQDITRAESIEILVNLMDNIGLIEY